MQWPYHTTSYRNTSAFFYLVKTSQHPLHFRSDDETSDRHLVPIHRIPKKKKNDKTTKRQNKRREKQHSLDRVSKAKKNKQTKKQPKTKTRAKNNCSALDGVSQNARLNQNQFQIVCSPKKWTQFFFGPFLDPFYHGTAVLWTKHLTILEIYHYGGTY